MRYKRLFTVEEARAMIPELRPRLREMAEVAESLAPYESEINHLAQRADMGGGTLSAPGSYIVEVQKLKDSLSFLRENGIELKNLATGLVDFPAERDGRVVYLCWNMNEETITHWHEIETGFAGRQPLEN